MKKGIIYMVTNLVNSKIYIGQTCQTLIARKKQHEKLRGKKIGFSKALEKYGIENFKWEILETIIIETEKDYNILDELEVFYIKKFNSFCGNKDSNGYNLTKGGLRIFGASGENYYLNRMSEEERLLWLKQHRDGENNPNYGNGENLSGENHFSKRMSEEEYKHWVDCAKGDNNYQKKMTKEELVDKCWVNSADEEKIKKWKDKFKGDNNPFKKAYMKNPEKYKEIYGKLRGKTGSNATFYKCYIVIFPDGREYYIESVSGFCELFNSKNKIQLLRPGLYKTVSGKIHDYKGFKCRYFNTEMDSHILKYNGEIYEV
jgi:group I intron endonuclease